GSRPGRQPRPPRHAAVVRGHAAFAQALLELVRDALDQTARVYEHDGRPVRAHAAGDAVVDVGPQLVGGDRPELLVGDLDREVEGAAVPDVDDRARTRRRRADEQARHLLDGALRGAEPDAL